MHKIGGGAAIAIMMIAPRFIGRDKEAMPVICRNMSESKKVTKFLRASEAGYLLLAAAAVALFTP
jgi:hypothetical protein